jgi:hypothetical protein
MSDAAPWRAALTSPATVAALLYLAVVVRLLTRVGKVEDGETRARADDRAAADLAPQRHSLV